MCPNLSLFITDELISIDFMGQPSTHSYSITSHSVTLSTMMVLIASYNLIHVNLNLYHRYSSWLLDPSIPLLRYTCLLGYSIKCLKHVSKPELICSINNPLQNNILYSSWGYSIYFLLSILYQILKSVNFLSFYPSLSLLFPQSCWSFPNAGPISPLASALSYCVHLVSFLLHTISSSRPSC